MRSAAIGMSLSLCFFVSSCASPGKGATAEKSYNSCAPIIDALEKFKVKNDKYPENLAELKSITPDNFPTELNGWPLVYRKLNQEFSLQFEYSGPGMNQCIYVPSSKWKCVGWY